MLGVVKGRTTLVELNVKDEEVNVMAKEAKIKEEKHDVGAIRCGGTVG